MVKTNKVRFWENRISQVGNFTRRLIAEGVGTFVLVLGGVGSAVLAGSSIGLVGISLAFGLSLLAMVYAVGPISGCHVNPAVTLGAYLSGKMDDSRLAVGYVVAQIAGAAIASAVIYLIANGLPEGYDAGVAGLGANGYGAHSPNQFSMGAAFLTETLMTFLLVFTVIGATDKKTPPGFAGIPIGLVLTLIHLVSIPVTNTSVNPARSIGPALFAGSWALSQLWLFVLAPCVGAGIAAAVFRVIREPTELISTREAETAKSSASAA